MEISDERGVKDEGMGHPGLLFWSVSLPVHQALKASSPAAHIQQTSDRVCQVIIHDLGE